MRGGVIFSLIGLGVRAVEKIEGQRSGATNDGNRDGSQTHGVELDQQYGPHGPPVILRSPLCHYYARRTTDLSILPSFPFGHQ